MKNISEIRADFPLLSRTVYKNKPLVYFDNGATTQKPQCVLDAVREVYTNYNGNIHRGVHAMSDMTSEAYEKARETVRVFIDASKREEVVFTSGTTGAINAIAFSFGEKYIKAGDEIIVSQLEHHANIVPWQMVCERKNAILKVIPINESGEVLVEEFKRLINDKTRLVAIAQVSNVLGTKLPVTQIINIAHAHGIPVLVDGAQGIQHGNTSVTALDCDFYVFSGHKIYGPTGIGVLYGKEKWLADLPPYQGGGDMVEKVTFEKTTYNQLPFKFEAGTVNYAGAIGLARALDYLDELGREDISAREKDLLEYASGRLSEIKNLKIFGTSVDKIATMSFLIDGIHQYDTGTILDKLGIAVRTGTHCAQPLMEFYGIEGTVRASMCFYNTREEIDVLADGIERVKQMFL